MFMGFKNIIKSIGLFLSVPLLMLIPYILLGSPIFFFKVIFDFEDTIINPAIKGNYTPIIVFLVLSVLILIYIGWLILEGIKYRYDSKINKLESVFRSKEIALNKEHQTKLNKLNGKEIELNKRESHFRELTTGKDYIFGKIPQAVSDVETIDFALTAEYLEHKPRPAHGTAEIIKREFRNKAKEAIIQQKIATYKLQILLSAFPSLSEYLEDEEGIEELSQHNSTSEIEETRDRSKDFLSDEEWKKLSTSQRNQLALDRYIKKRKSSNWAIGRDYEMACAHILKGKGYFVKMHGIEKRLEDLGRDLIATKIVGSKYEIYIIQCKYWGSDKTIRENTIMQLYGTTIAYKIEHSDIFDEIRRISPILMIPSFSILSETAQKFADILNIKIVRQDLIEFPRIKCNINGNSKIYHLPFDQQYDRTQINSKGEFYAWTVAEAEEKGFRRAMRHIYQ